VSFRARRFPAFVVVRARAVAAISAPLGDALDLAMALPFAALLFTSIIYD
jgi:hypothetical protein